MNMRAIGVCGLAAMLLTVAACTSPTASRVPRTDDGKPKTVDPPTTSQLQQSAALDRVSFA
jgi:hypothetical protein